MEDWKKYKLGDVARLVRESWKVGDEELPYIALKHINEGQLSINSVGYSNEVGSNKYRFDSSTFLFGKLRPYFRKLYRPNFEGICSTDIWVIAPNGENDKDFLFYFFANQEFINVSYATSSGTRMPRANWNHMAKTVWDFPELPEQRAIASVLSSLDDKIDLLHRQNQTLEAMAETLFRQWFIEEAEEDWEEVQLGDLFKIKGGFSYKGKFIGKGKSLLLGMGCVSHTERFLMTGARAYSGATSEKHLVNPGDIIIATRQQSENMPILGFPAIIPEEFYGKKIIVGTNLYQVINNSKFSNYLIYILLKSSDYKKHIRASAKGSTVRMITKDAIETYKISLPPKNIIEKLERQIKLINKKSILLISQIQTLTQLRDTLLPKLMSGEVRVNQSVRC